MRKKGILFLCLILIVLVGCSNDVDTSNDSGETLYESQEAPVQGNEDQDVFVQESEDQEQTLVLGEFTVSEGKSHFDDRDTGVDIISLEEAAQIGGDSILEFFGNNLDDAHIELVYNYNPHISRRTWHGVISQTMEGLEGWNNVSMDFLVNAETGEIITVGYWNIEPLHGISSFMMETMPDAELLEIFPEPDEAEIAEMMEVVRGIADRFLQDSEIVTIEYGWWIEDGEPDTSYSPSQNSPFFIIDSKGCLIEIIIQRETHLLIEIHKPL